MKIRTNRAHTLDNESVKLITRRCDHGFFFLTCVLCERIDQCEFEGIEPDWFFIPAMRSRHALN